MKEALINLGEFRDSLIIMMENNSQYCFYKLF